MDDWHRRLASDIVAETPAGKLGDGEATLEIAFGDARSALTYALELARAHRLPAAGSVVGDHMWMRLGDGKLRLTLNRRAATIEADVSIGPEPAAKDGKTGKDAAASHASPASRVTVVRWSDGQRALCDDQGAQADLGVVARAAIDALVAEWKAKPAGEKRLSSAPPPDLEDTPTRG
jgi:hypothetical protein